MNWIKKLFGTKEKELPKHEAKTRNMNHINSFTRDSDLYEELQRKRRREEEGFMNIFAVDAFLNSTTTDYSSAGDVSSETHTSGFSSGFGGGDYSGGGAGGYWSDSSSDSGGSYDSGSSDYGSSDNSSSSCD